MSEMKTTAVSEKPILFKGEMVRAILEGRKVETRRVVETPSWLKSHLPIIGPIGRSHYETHWPGIGFNDDGRFSIMENGIKYSNNFIVCPYGKPGDLLWVRENFKTVAKGDIIGEQAGYISHGYYYEADKSTVWGDPVKIYVSGNQEIIDCGRIGIIKPSIHMPYSACRLKLEITNVRIEHLLDIDDKGSMAEGCDAYLTGHGLCTENPRHYMMKEGTWRNGFLSLWDSINKSRGFGSDVNPWVWVIEFKKV